MREQSDKAEVRVIFYLGNDKYEVIHSLYEHRLKKVFINNEEISGENVNYDTYEKKYCILSCINSFLFRIPIV